MSYFASAKILRDYVDRLRRKDFGVTPAQVEAGRQAMRIFSTPVLDALRAEWTAQILEQQALVLERYGRDSETPLPPARK